MKMSRKFKFIAIAVVLASMAGCSTTWLSTFSGYVKIAGPILIQVLDIVSLARGIPVNPALQAKINADQAALNTLAASVNTASTANLPTTCAAFNLAVSTFAGDLTAIEQLGNVGPGTSGEIGAIIGIAQTAIQEVEIPVASCQNAPNPAAARLVLQSAALKVAGPNDVLRRFNAVVDKKHQVHLHSAPVRWATFNKLQ